MYSRIVRSVLNTSTKVSKRKINKSTTLVFPTSLTLPKLLASCTSQYSAQHYSSGKESLDKKWSDEDSTREQFNNQEYDTDEDENGSSFLDKLDLSNPKEYFKEKDQAKLEKLLKDNPEMEQLKKIIELEMKVLQQDGECVPSMLQPREWVQMLTLKSRGQRKKFYKVLFVNEKVDAKTKKKKEERQAELMKVREDRKNEVPSDEIKYGFAHNFMLRRIGNTYINNHQHWNSLKAMMFGNKIVFDCSYDSHMTNLEAKSCAKQINESYAINRAHNFPFEIFLTNVNYDGLMMDTLHRQIPTLFEEDFPITVTEKSYLELFDRSSLCYLSSNAPTVMEEYDPDTIYIIGGFVDKGSKQPVSFGKAKREGIRMAKLPLDKYLQFGCGGGRDLTLNQVCGIMLDAQNKSWPEAFKHVPTRKLFSSRVASLENKIRRHMMIEERHVNKRTNSNYNNENFSMNRHRSLNYDKDNFSTDRRRTSNYNNNNFSTDRRRTSNYNNNNFSTDRRTSNYNNDNFSTDRRRTSNYDNENSSDNIFNSESATDFSHSARTKYREKWNK